MSNPPKRPSASELPPRDPNETTCATCEGRGELPDGKKCATCEGRGWTLINQPAKSEPPPAGKPGKDKGGKK